MCRCACIKGEWIVLNERNRQREKIVYSFFFLGFYHFSSLHRALSASPSRSSSSINLYFLNSVVSLINTRQLRWLSHALFQIILTCSIELGYIDRRFEMRSQIWTTDFPRSTDIPPWHDRACFLYLSPINITVKWFC